MADVLTMNSTHSPFGSTTGSSNTQATSGWGASTVTNALKSIASKFMQTQTAKNQVKAELAKERGPLRLVVKPSTNDTTSVDSKDEDVTSVATSPPSESVASTDNSSAESTFLDDIDPDDDLFVVDTENNTTVDTRNTWRKLDKSADRTFSGSTKSAISTRDGNGRLVYNVPRAGKRRVTFNRTTTANDGTTGKIAKVNKDWKKKKYAGEKSRSSMADPKKQIQLEMQNNKKQRAQAAAHQLTALQNDALSFVPISGATIQDLSEEHFGLLKEFGSNWRDSSKIGEAETAVKWEGQMKKLRDAGYITDEELASAYPTLAKYPSLVHALEANDTEFADWCGSIVRLITKQGSKVIFSDQSELESYLGKDLASIAAHIPGLKAAKEQVNAVRQEKAQKAAMRTARKAANGPVKTAVSDSEYATLRDTAISDLMTYQAESAAEAAGESSADGLTARKRLMEKLRHKKKFVPFEVDMIYPVLGAFRDTLGTGYSMDDLAMSLEQAHNDKVQAETGAPVTEANSFDPSKSPEAMQLLKVFGAQSAAMRKREQSIAIPQLQDEEAAAETPANVAEALKRLNTESNSANTGSGFTEEEDFGLGHLGL